MEKNILSDTNTFGYIIISIIGTLFFVGSGSIITDIIIAVPPLMTYKKPEEKVILDVSLLSGIDVGHHSDVNDSNLSLNSNILEKI